MASTRSCRRTTCVPRYSHAQSSRAPAGWCSRSIVAHVLVAILPPAPTYYAPGGTGWGRRGRGPGSSSLEPQWPCWRCNAGSGGTHGEPRGKSNTGP
eukprot:scaffold1549_cov350-Prasinococcus_capsulatus_cf.AAC.23